MQCANGVELAHSSLASHMSAADLAAQIHDYYAKVAPHRLTDAHPADPTIIAEAYVDKQFLLNEKLRGLYGIDLDSLSVADAVPAPDEAMETRIKVTLPPVHANVDAVILCRCSSRQVSLLVTRAPTKFQPARSSRCCISRRSHFERH
jgi:hypothetical protein